MGKKALVLQKEMTKKKMYLFMHHLLKLQAMHFLKEGDKIEFELEDGAKGPSAVNLKKID